jgi:hypothetical protein
MDIHYLVPTRGRPSNAMRLAQAWRETASPSTRLTFLLDDDDPELNNYLARFTHPSTDRDLFGYQVGPRRRLGGTLNHYAPIMAKHCDAIGFMGDDHLPRTPGWDTTLGRIVAAAPGAIVYGNDLIQGMNLPTAVLMDSRVVAALGFMVPPGLVHMFMDNFWRDLGRELGRLVYRPDVVIEHLHPIAGKVEWDDRYLEVNDGVVMAADEAAYRVFQDVGMGRAVARVTRMIQGATL